MGTVFSHHVVVGDEYTTSSWVGCPSWITLGQHEQESNQKAVYIRLRKLSTITEDQEGKKLKTFYYEWLVDKDSEEESSSSSSSSSSLSPSSSSSEDVDWEEGNLSPALNNMPSDFPETGSFSVALGSRIYVLCGLVHNPGTRSSYRFIPQTAVFSCDVAHPEEGWKRGPALNFGRKDASAVAINGRIYVFGGLAHISDWQKLPYTEVLDHALGKWISLSPPPADPFKIPNGIPIGDVVFPIGDVVYMPPLVHDAHPLPNGRILVNVDWALLSYDIEADKYSLLDPYFDIELSRGLAVVDNVLFCFREDNLMWGYDLGKQIWSLSPVMGLERAAFPSEVVLESFLIYLGGGRLCMVSYPYLGRTNSSTCDFSLYSIIFRVKKGTSLDGGDLYKASIESKKTYPIQGVQVVDCLAL